MPSTKWVLERETGLEPATLSLERLFVYSPCTPRGRRMQSAPAGEPGHVALDVVVVAQVARVFVDPRQDVGDVGG